MKKQLKRCLANALALLMVLSSVAMPPINVFGEEPVYEPAEITSVEITEQPAAAEVFSAGSAPAWAGRVIQSDDAVGDEDGLFLPPELSIPEPEGDFYEDGFSPLFFTTPRSPTFSHRGGAHPNAFDLSIHGYGAFVRVAFDGSIPVVCANYPHPHTEAHFLPTNYLTMAGFPHIRAACGCSFLLPAGQTMRIDYAIPAWANSPMSVHAVGRANPGPWNVAWSTDAMLGIEDTGYTTPVSNRFFHSQGGSVNPVNSTTASGNPSGGYFTAGLVYNGVAIRARGFSSDGEPGPVSTQTFIVNRAGLEWTGARILSIVIPPEEFTHPVLGLMRNWDRQLRRRTGPGSANCDCPSASVCPGRLPGGGTGGCVPFSDWVSQGPPHLGAQRPSFWPAPMRDRYPYDWPAQIEAGLWDGYDTAGNRVAGIPEGGYGLIVRRNADGEALSMGYQNLGPRHIANIEMYGEDGEMIINQLGRTWLFGNWSRMIPLRSMRINFNQAGGDVRNTPNLIPGTRRHFHAPNEPVTDFRHINIRQADFEGTDLRDPLSMWLMHPLRPMIQNATYAAVFVNGEFWGMNNVSAHRHAHLIGEMYGIPRSTIEISDDTWLDRIANRYIMYPPTNSTYPPAHVTAPPGVTLPPRVTIQGRSIDITPGTRRTALGNPNPAYEGGFDGYARRVPDVFPDCHPRAGESTGDWAGQDHLSRAWFDYLDTVMCVDNFIDWYIAYYHLENWDWVNNNAEAWRTSYHLGVDPHTGEDIWGLPRVIPGMYGADGRWRFITQDFDNAIFHGANDMMTYFTGMLSPTCFAGGCANCGNANPEFSRPLASQCNAEPMRGGLPFDIFRNNSTWRRPERSSRVFRVLFQNPYFREQFAARYSTYTGTAFHPARVNRIIDEYAAPRFSLQGRHLYRWGHMGSDSNVGVPWAQGAGGSPLTTVPTDIFNARAGNWRGGSPGNRWTPHTLDARTSMGANTYRGTVAFHTGTGALRSQAGILGLRAAPGSTTFRGHSGNEWNAIEHIRNYFAMQPSTNNRPTNQTFGTWGRENLGLEVGTIGQYSRVNWRVNGPDGNNEAALAGDIGWLNVAGAHIRADLFGWGSLPYALGTNTSNPAMISAFPDFHIGSFSARYVRNMPIPVTATAQPGYIFSHFTVTGATAVIVGGGFDSDGQTIIGGETVSGNIEHSTIRVIPGATAVTVTAHFNRGEPTAIIHQVYGQGSPGENAISHGFIELYNPGPGTVNLTGRSIQIQNIVDGAPGNLTAPPWQVLQFPSGTTIPANHSFLIVSGGWANTNTNPAMGHVPRVILPVVNGTVADMVWPGVEFSNRNMSVALVDGTAPLPTVMPNGGRDRADIDDLVGVRNQAPPRDQVHNVWGHAAANRMSRSASARRIWEFDAIGNFVPGSVSITENNYLDFEEIRFGELNRAEIELFRPRRMSDGAWPAEITVTYPVTIMAGGYGARAFHNPAGAGQIVALEAGESPVGIIFSHWTPVEPANLVINNPDSDWDAYFVMPNPPVPVTIRANFMPMTPAEGSIVINQMHGQGLSSISNAISHGFIELFNPSEETVNLRDYALHIMNEDFGSWHVIDLPAHEMAPQTSFLVVSTGGYSTNANVPRLVIENWDYDTTFRFSHNAMTAAVVRGNATLSPRITASEMENVVDLVAARNETSDNVLNYWGAAPAMRMWRQGAVRRVSMSNPPCNETDFIRVDYRFPLNYPGRPTVNPPDEHRDGIDTYDFEYFRPRYSGDGPRGVLPGAPGTTRIENGGFEGAGASPNPAAAGQRVNVSAGYNGGYEFLGWTAISGITLDELNIVDGTPRAYFYMPDPVVAVVLRARWRELYNVTISASVAPEGQSGAGTYNVGERVQIFAGTSRPGGYFFAGWVGLDANLLADPSASVTYFAMPARNVHLTATWSEVEGSASPFPMTLVGIQNDPRFTHARWATGHRVYNQGAIGYLEPFGNSVSTITIDDPGDFSLAIQTSRNNGIRWDMHNYHRVIHITVAPNGAVTSPNTYRVADWGDGRHTYTTHGRVSTRPGSDNIYVSYAVGAQQTIMNPEVGIPSGHRPQSLVDLFYLNVNGFNGVTGAAAAPISGTGRFPEGILVTINAGSQAGQMFTGWSVVGDGVVLRDPFNPITTFIMPDNNVTVTANWGLDNRVEPTIFWPTGLEATVGNTLADIALPRNEGVNASPGTFAWEAPATSSVGPVGTRTFVLNFVPDNASDFFTAQERVTVTVVPAVATEPALPTATPVRQGYPLSTSTLSGTTNGTWSWANPTYAPAILGYHSFEVRFAPTDTTTIDWSILPGWDAATRTLIGRYVEVEVVDPSIVFSNVYVYSNGVGASPHEREFPSGSVVSVNAGTRAGYAFSHWYVTSAAPLMGDFDANSAITSFVMPTNEVTLVAHFVSTTHAITINYNGGVLSGNPATANAGDIVTINAGDNSPNGFSHWSVVSGGVVLADSLSWSTSFVMPNNPVEFEVHWNERFTVTIAGGHAAPGESGAGTYSPGDRVVIFGGLRTDNHFFTRWTGADADIALLGNSNAVITYFIMPSQNVTLTANWVEITGAFPMTFRPMVNDPDFTRGRFEPGHSQDGGGYFPLMSALPDWTMDEPGNFTLIAGRAGMQHHVGDGVNGGRMLHVTVAPDGAVTVAGIRGDWGWAVSQNVNTGNGRVSNLDGVNYISYGPSTTPGGTGVGAAEVAGQSFAVTVNDSHATSEELSGAGSFPDGRLIAINAGERPGFRFVNWTVNAGGVTLSSITNPIATFTMPEDDVEVTANWVPLGDPDVVWPTLEATFGQTLGDVAISANAGTTPGTFTWTISPDVSVGNVGSNPHSLTFTPTDTNYNVVSEYVIVEVAARPVGNNELTFPTASDLTAGQPLSASMLTGGSTNGTWAWLNPTHAPSVGTANHYVVFTPTDTTTLDWSGLEGYYNPSGNAATIRRPVSVTVELGAPTVRVTASNRAVAAGAEYVDIVLRLEENSGITGLQFGVDFDPAILSVIEITRATGLAGMNLQTSSLPAVGTNPLVFLFEAANSPLDVSTSRGDIATIRFGINDDAPMGTTVIGMNLLMATVAANYDLVEVNAVADNGSVSITDFIPGDVNSDSAVDGADVILMRSHIVGYPVNINEQAADVNADGVVDGADVILVRAYIVGHPVTLQRSPGILAQTFSLENQDRILSALTRLSDALAAFEPLTIGNFVASATRVSDAAVGSLVDVVLRVDENPGVAVMQIGMQYDDTVLERVSITRAPGLEDMNLMIGSLPPAGQNPAVILAEIASDPNDVTNAVGELATVTFRVLADTPTQIELIAQNVSYLQNWGTMNVPVGNIVLNNGSVNVLAEPSIIINQIFGAGGAGDNAANLSFIELYNPTGARFYFEGYSVQMQNLGDPAGPMVGSTPWVALTTELDGLFIEPYSSFLITAGVIHPSTNPNAKTVVNSDLSWGSDHFSNRNFSVAVVRGRGLLPNIVPETGSVRDSIVDMVGAINTPTEFNTRDRIDNYLGEATRITRSQGARRIFFVNTENNVADFEPVRYAEITELGWQHFRPRGRADGEWTMALGATAHDITIVSQGTNPDPNAVVGAGSSRPAVTSARENQYIEVNAGRTSEAYEFHRWIVTPSDLVLDNVYSAITSFVMPDAPVTLEAEFISTGIPVMPEPTLLINQIHGQGPVGTNAISHGFIELYNPMDSNIRLSGLSVQIQNPVDPGSSGTPPVNVPWQVLALNPAGSTSNNLVNIDGYYYLPPGHSYLIVSIPAWEVPANHTVRYIVPVWDQVFADQEFSNRSMSVAIVQGDTPLTSPHIAPDERPYILDLVGAYNSNHGDGLRDRVDNYLVRPRGNDGISRQRSIRRDWEDGEIVNTRNNRSDFTSIHFGNISEDELDEFRPRSSHDGAWPGATVRFNPATVSITDANLTQVVNVTGSATGNIAVSWLDEYVPEGVTISYSATEGTITITGVRPDTFVPPITGEFTISVTREDVTSHFTVNVRLTSTDTGLAAPSVIINQIYGQGDNDGENAVSHGFIELHNLTNYPVDISGWSLQLQMNPYDGRQPNANNPYRNPDGAATPQDWVIIDLPDRSIPANTSFLIISDTWENQNPRYTIPRYDLRTDIEFSNRNMSVAIVTNQEPLSPILTPEDRARMVDLVGAINECPTIGSRDRIHNMLGDLPALRISRSEAARRIWNGNVPQNERDNRADFEPIRYAADGDALTMEELAPFLPRSIYHGAWPVTFAPNTITVNYGTANPPSAIAGFKVTLNAPSRPGYLFMGWESDELDFEDRPMVQNGFVFVMPETAVTITAVWELDTATEDVELMVLRHLPPTPISNLMPDYGEPNTSTNRFNATGGLFQLSSHLTAWSNNEQVSIGSHNAGNTMTPVGFRNQSTGDIGWRAYDPDAPSGHMDYGITMEQAVAWQIQFSTEGFENIRFSAQQKSTGSGPNRFALAWSADGAEWHSIEDSSAMPLRVSDDTTGVFDDDASVTYTNFLLPEEVNDLETVFLRVHGYRFGHINTAEAGEPDTVEQRTNGNTSINNIVIIGDVAAERIPVEGVEIYEDDFTLEVGETEQLTANVTPDNATRRTVTWSSSDTDVATVSATGLVTAVSPGTAVITATSVDNDTIYDSVTVTVTGEDPIPVEGVEIYEDDFTLEVGETEQLTADVTPDNATNRAVTWSSSDTDVATVSATGLVTAVAPGTAVITVTSVDNDAISDSVTVTVTAAFVPVTSISGVPSNGIVDEPLMLTATVEPVNATNRHILWWSVEDGEATLMGDYMGGISVIATAPGPVVVRATIENGAAPDEDFYYDFTIMFVVDGTLTFEVTIEDGGEGVSEHPDPLPEGTHVAINAGSRISEGYVFYRWEWEVIYVPLDDMDVGFLSTSPAAFDIAGMFEAMDVFAPANVVVVCYYCEIQHDINIANCRSATTTFIMPSGNIVLTAIWTEHIYVAPAPPTNLTVAPRNGRLILNWTAPENEIVQRYEVSMDGGTTWVEIVDDIYSDNGIGRRYRHIFYGLTNGTEYTLMVRVVGTEGELGEAAEIAGTPSEIMMGDVNRDGRVTSADAGLLARWLITPANLREELFPNFCVLAADIDGDGEITPADLTLFAKWLIGHQIREYFYSLRP